MQLCSFKILNQMKLKYFVGMLLMGALSFAVFPYVADAQAYVRFVNQHEIISRTAHSDSVLNFVPIPNGATRLDSYPLINVAALELAQIQQQGGELLEVWICGATSPEGNLKDNTKLADDRIQAVADYIKNITQVPDHKIVKENLNEDWYTLYKLVQENDVPCKYDVLFIIRTMQGDERKSALRKLDDGKVWDYLKTELFPQIRGVRFAFFCKKGYEPQIKHVVDTVYVRDTVVIVKEVVYMGKPVQKDIPVTEARPVVTETKPAVKSTEPAVQKTISKKPLASTPWYGAVKTDIATDALALVQGGFEIQLSDRISLDLMGWYSEWAYINPCDEHKVYGFRPEIRYWLKGAMSKGLFFGLHANAAWYSMMVNDVDFYQNASLCKDDGCSRTHFYQYTYQNSDGVNVTNYYHDTPAWSTGLTIGYSLSLDKSDKWAVEFVAGAGYAHYEQNWYRKSSPWSLNSIEEPQVHDYFGLTRAGVNLRYRFSVRKYDKDATKY